MIRKINHLAVYGNEVADDNVKDSLLHLQGKVNTLIDVVNKLLLAHPEMIKNLGEEINNDSR